MSKATEFTGFQHVDGTDYKYVLTDTLYWDIGIEGSGWTLEIPNGFKFDSSVPWFLRWLVSPNYEPWLLAACVHDYLLANSFDYAFAAGEWYRAARAKDPTGFLVTLAYYGVSFWTVRTGKTVS